MVGTLGGGCLPWAHGNLNYEAWLAADEVGMCVCMCVCVCTCVYVCDDYEWPLLHCTAASVYYACKCMHVPIH